MFIALTVLAAAQANAWQPSSEAFPIESNLKVSVAKIDITPPPDTKVVGHVRPTHGARDPIRAAILLLERWQDQGGHRHFRPDLRLG